MAEPELVPATTRRALIAGAGAACAVVVAGCSTYNANNGGINGGAPADTSAPASATSAAGGGATSTGGSGGGGGASAAAPAALATTAEIPVDGGKILTDKKIVITQPVAGTFKAFTAVCTHQGCTVSTVAGGTIDCPCHGSKFSVKDGSVVNGPAASPLAAVAIKVDGGSILPG
jgi:nitrite reductase/ring-hydroxylating ferredoxin subunit